MAETDPRVIVCVWRRGWEGLTAAQIFRNTFAFFRQGQPVHRCQSGCTLFEAARRDVNLILQRPCKIHTIWVTQAQAGNSSFDKLAKNFWLTLRECTSAYVRMRCRAQLEARGQVNKDLWTVCAITYNLYAHPHLSGRSRATVTKIFKVHVPFVYLWHCLKVNKLALAK